MRDGWVVSQRELAGVTLRLKDGAWYAKYVFPFFDPSWKVRFLLLDVLGGVPRMTSGIASMEGRELRVAADRGQIPRFDAMEPVRLEGLLHFDPWWALKGGATLPDDLRRTALATNVADRSVALNGSWRVQDVAFDAEFSFVVSVHVQDARFHKRRFGQGELDLGTLGG